MCLTRAGQVEKLGILASLTSDFHNEELGSMLGEEISRIMQDQRSLERRYEELIQERRNMKGISNRMKYQANENEIQQIRAERGALETLLVNPAHEMQFASFNSLAEVVEKGQRMMEHMKVVLAREKELSESVARLKQELNEERSNFEREVLSKNELIAELKETLQAKKSETAIELRYLAKEFKANYHCTQREREKEMKELQDRIEQIEKEIDIEKQANELQQEFQRRKLVAMSEKSEAWDHKFEADLAFKTKELENLKEERESDLLRLYELEKRYNQDIAARQAKEDEERRMKELEAMRVAAAEREFRAATLLQCNIRMHLARECVSDLKNPKKKKGKKGKAAGKKKK
ncbi:hypothetical protein GUITHDRAFT_90679 [Guillardia theta CCMP2712]|uniref:Uncharacterized protein n=1 Tax=Guillardia theta (strain CCMP2712) TaxID=905079 RepID=L1ICN4_GUITC|nr:hypothetical protein GUITHDRAFT_90679 [Guillardia theta CCMP2712]EKX33684.1 hypothetical protein GUITHDRAFT_90679 [Guillardia theta CCMP2712]|eukprot:XP_005820664.1 hypothetical protein GUITHDRAFT_90679 [Guillardia theta CCMP2712]